MHRLDGLLVFLSLSTKNSSKPGLCSHCGMCRATVPFAGISAKQLQQQTAFPLFLSAEDETLLYWEAVVREASRGMLIHVVGVWNLLFY